MKRATTLGLLAITLLVVGCSQQNSSAPPAKSKGTAKKTDHGHGKGPNGGVIFDLGKHHAEFTVDHDKKECTINIVGDDEKTPTFVVVKELTLTTKATKTQDGKAVAPMTIKLLPKDATNGKASKLVGSDAGLGNVADFSGTVLGEIDGRPSQGEFQEDDHGDDHKHEKKK